MTDNIECANKKIEEAKVIMSKVEQMEGCSITFGRYTTFGPDERKWIESLGVEE